MGWFSGKWSFLVHSAYVMVHFKSSIFQYQWYNHYPDECPLLKAVESKDYIQSWSRPWCVATRGWQRGGSSISPKQVEIQGWGTTEHLGMRRLREWYRAFWGWRRKWCHCKFKLLQLGRSLCMLLHEVVVHFKIWNVFTSISFLSGVMGAFPR